MSTIPIPTKHMTCGTQRVTLCGIKRMFPQKERKRKWPIYNNDGEHIVLRCTKSVDKNGTPKKIKGLVGY